MLKFSILLFRRLILTVSICDSSTLSGNKAAEALDIYIRRLENRKVKGLTEKQAYALIKTAKVLQDAILHS